MIYIKKSILYTLLLFFTLLRVTGQNKQEISPVYEKTYGGVVYINDNDITEYLTESIERNIDTYTGCYKNPNDEVYRTLYKFDLSTVSIPTNFYLSNAKLKLTVAEENTYKGTLNLNKVIGKWENYELIPFFPTTSMLNKSVIIEPSNGSIKVLEIDVTSYVLNWINSPSSNHGMILKMYSEKTHGLMSEVGALIYSNNNSESYKKPKLELTFSPKQSVIENEEINWSYQSTFNEEGVLTSEAMQYMDNGGNVVQTQVKSLQNNNFLTQQTVNNEFGMPGLSTLVAPNFNTKFQYKSGFIKNINGQNYSADDYRKRIKTGALGEVNNPLTVSNNEKGSVGWYYSNNNDIKDHNTVPSTGFPYMASDVSKSIKPGIVKKSSMAGEGLQMGSGHESKMFSMPTAGELYYVFGINSDWDKIYEPSSNNTVSQLYHGMLIDKKVVKNITKDPNGKERIQFYDISGQLVAECNSGVGNRYLKVKSEIKYPFFYTDIHLPVGCEKTLILHFPKIGDEYLIFDLEKEQYVKHDGSYTNTISLETYFRSNNPTDKLKPGYYRVNYFSDGGQKTTDEVYLNYQLRYDDFTLYYYDKVGRLVSVIPPSGVDYTYQPIVNYSGQYIGLEALDNQSHIYNCNGTQNDNAFLLFDVFISNSFYTPPGCTNCSSSQSRQPGTTYNYAINNDSYISTNVGINNNNINNINNNPYNNGEKLPWVPSLEYRVNYDFAYQVIITYNDNTVETSKTLHLSANYLRYVREFNKLTWYNWWSFSKPDNYSYLPLKAKEIKNIEFKIIHIHSKIDNGNYVNFTVEQGSFWDDHDFYDPHDPNHVVDSISIIQQQLVFNVFSKKISLPYKTLAHKMAKTYNYNSLGQLTESYSPDAGVVKYVYDDLGRLKFSQTQEQINFTEETGKLKRNFVDYDKFYRVVASGTYVQNQTGGGITTSTSITETEKSKIVDINLAEYSQIFYDIPFENLASFAELPETYVQRNTQGEVSYTRNDNSITCYSYDEYARVEWMVVHNYDIGAKTFHYKYDANGNIEKFIYQKDTPKERFEHDYYYDADGRLTKVMAINYRVYKEGEILPDEPKELAKYYYYLHGPLRRVEIDNDLQGIDYVYTINNWLKSINTPAKENYNNIVQDVGLDGNATSEHSNFKPDVFGMSLDYFNGDYQRNGKDYLNNTNLSNAPQYNGNIRAINWKNTIDQNNIADNKQCVYNYSYNDNNWLTEAKYDVYNITTNIYDPNPDRNFAMTNITYDKNGNLLTLYRNAYKATGMNLGTIDRLQYNYAPNSNKLLNITDAEASNDFDREVGIEIDQTTDNYQYDANGRLIADVKKGHYFIYTETDLVKAIYNDANHEKLIVEYDYNEYGQRICKRVPLGREIQETWYINTPGGGTFAVYNRNTIEGEGETPIPSLSQIMLMGGSRLGVFEKQENLYKYELTDHLGNTRSVISRNNTGDAIVFHTAADYYPWGLEMPGRTSNLNNFRFGHQGQFAEKDPETNYDNFELRMWDSRICRWMVPDPYQQYHSSYVGMGNNPINLIDPDGGITIDIDGMILTGTMAERYINNLNPNSIESASWAGFGNGQGDWKSSDGGKLYFSEQKQRRDEGMERRAKEYQEYIFNNKPKYIKKYDNNLGVNKNGFLGFENNNYLTVPINLYLLDDNGKFKDVDNNGKFEEGIDFMKIDKEIIKNFDHKEQSYSSMETKTETVIRDYSFTSNSEYAMNLFKFLSKNTIVEWSVTNMNKGNQITNLISTSHYDFTVQIKDIIDGYMKIGWIVNYSGHNHPSGSTKTSKKDGDEGFAEEIRKKSPNATFFIFTKPNKITPYGSPKK